MRTRKPIVLGLALSTLMTVVGVAPTTALASEGVGNTLPGPNVISYRRMAELGLYEQYEFASSEDITLQGTRLSDGSCQFYYEAVMSEDFGERLVAQEYDPDTCTMLAEVGITTDLEVLLGESGSVYDPETWYGDSQGRRGLEAYTAAEAEEAQLRAQATVTDAAPLRAGGRATTYETSTRSAWEEPARWLACEAFGYGSPQCEAGRQRITPVNRVVTTVKWRVDDTANYGSNGSATSEWLKGTGWSEQVHSTRLVLSGSTHTYETDAIYVNDTFCASVLAFLEGISIDNIFELVPDTDFIQEGDTYARYIPNYVRVTPRNGEFAVHGSRPNVSGGCSNFLRYTSTGTPINVVG